jgi:hypothetical protein
MENQMTTWCWPCSSKKFHAPPKYTINNFSKIPTGSLYLASKRGPLSEASTRIHGLSFDTIGIVFQSSGKKEGTYIYTIDPVLNKIVTLSLPDLIKHNDIKSHGILPLKDFEEEDEEQKKYFREKRTSILRNLFKTYRKHNPKYDNYQNLAATIGFPLSDENRLENLLTASELVGLILFQTGLICDNRTQKGNVTLKTPQREESSDECCKRCDSDEIKNIYCKEDEDESDRRVEYNLKRYLEEMSEKGGDEYDSECYLEKRVYVRTILFRFLKPSDFLVGCKRLNENSLITRNTVANEMCLLAKQYGIKNINELKMSWYHNELIPLNTSNDKNVQDFAFLGNLVRKLKDEPKNPLWVSEDRLSAICKYTSKLSEQLHNLAGQCNSTIKWNKRYCHINNIDDEDDECKISVITDSECEFMIIIHKYMWNNDWEYVWKVPLNLPKEKIDFLCCETKELISNLVDLKDGIPESCIIFELIIYLIKQAHDLYSYIRKSHQKK